MVSATRSGSAELRGRTALPTGRADTALRVALAARRPIRRVVRVLRVVLAFVSVAGLVGWSFTGHATWTVYVAFGALAAIALGGLTSWPLASFGGWSTRSETARVLGDWLQAVVLAVGCLALPVALLLPESDSLVAAGGIVGLVCVTVGWLMPGLAWLVVAAGAEERERPVLERYQRLAQRDEIRREVARTPSRFAALPTPVVLRPSVTEPVVLEFDDEDLGPDDFDDAAGYAEWLAEDPLLTVRADSRSIVLADDDGNRRELRVGGRTLSTPDPDGPGGPVASLVVLIAAGLPPSPSAVSSTRRPSAGRATSADEPLFDADTEAALRRLAGDVDRVALLDASGRRVADLPEQAWSLRQLARLAGAAGVPCLAYRLDEDVLDRAEGRTPTGVSFDLIAAHHPAAPDLLDLTTV